MQTALVEGSRVGRSPRLRQDRRTGDADDIALGIGEVADGDIRRRGRLRPHQTGAAEPLRLRQRRLDIRNGAVEQHTPRKPGSAADTAKQHPFQLTVDLLKAFHHRAGFAGKARHLRNRGELKASGNALQPIGRHSERNGIEFTGTDGRKTDFHVYAFYCSKLLRYTARPRR